MLHRMQGLDDWIGLRLFGVGALDSVTPPLHADLHQLLLLHIVRDLCELHIEGSQCYQWRPQLLHRIDQFDDTHSLQEVIKLP